MTASTFLARCLAVVALLATTACSTYLDARAEAALRDALVRVVGPAESYDVRVSGASVDGSRFDRVRFIGRRIARADSPVLDRLELDLQGVVVDRAAKSLTAVAASRVELQLKGADLAVFLGRWLGEPVVTLTAVAATRVELQLKGADLAVFLGRWLGDPAVTLTVPDRIAIVGTPRIGAIALGGAAAAELQGRLVGNGAQLFLTIDRIRLGRGEAPPLARVIVERAINPIFDVGEAPLPARLDAVEVGADDTIRIAASGSRLPQAAP